MMIIWAATCLQESALRTTLWTGVGETLSNYVYSVPSTFLNMRRGSLKDKDLPVRVRFRAISRMDAGNNLSDNDRDPFIFN